MACSAFQFRFAVLAYLLVSSVTASGGDWPQWRGPGRDGLTGDPVPASLAETALTEAWSIPLGPSYSGPIVVGDHIYTTETVDKKREVVKAFDRKSGSQIWVADWDGAMSVPFFAAANGSWIRSTPACDEDSLYVAGMRDVLVCLDRFTGKVRWKKNFVQEFGSPLPAFGFVCSPLVIGDHVYVQAGGGFLKVDKRTGRVLWRTLEDGGGMNGSAFSSPVLAELSGIPQFVVQTRTHLTGVDFNTGKELWKQEVPAFRGMNIVTPVVYQGNIFTSSYGGATFLYRPELKPAGWEVTKVWENRVQGYMSTPVVIDGHVYLHMKNQRFTCINLATGEQTWTSTPYGKYWSMVASGNRILALDERGDLLLLNANPEKFELVESRHLTDDPAWAHLAVSGNQLVIRSLEKLTVLSSR